MRDFSFCIIISVILLFEVIFNLAVSRAFIKTINETANRTIQQRRNIF